MKRGGVRNQEVTDAQGRRRFHGAFTGGFSAGYYNSVGSEEGWRPQTYSSSRGNRSSRVEQRPEDFMDEDDDPLLGKRLETTERYDTLQTAAKRRLQQQRQADRAGSATIPGFALPEDWVLPVNDSIGAKLLKQMGWKEGHGIGQRVRRRKHQEDGEKLKLLMQDASGEKVEVEPQGEAEEEVYVPPRKVFDVQKSFPKPKLDRYGAGFDPYTDAPEFSMHKQQREEKLKEKDGSHRQVVSFLDALKSTSGSNRATSGYGLSALEENDDIDVYGSVSMSEFDRVIAPLGARNDVKRLDSSAQEYRWHDKLRLSRALCSDGRPVLPGFELASSNEKPPKAVNLRLVVPSGFKAYHRFDEDEGQDDAVTALYRKFNFSTDKTSNGVVVTAKQRGTLLGDAKSGSDNSAAAPEGSTSTTGSVFDLLGDYQKAKLFDAVAQAKQGFPPPRATQSTFIEEPTSKVRQPLVQGNGGDQFRATISASIAKRFVSSKSTADEGKSEAAQNEEPRAKLSHRSQSLWIPKALLCKRFHVKCAGPTGSSGKNDDDDKRRDLFDEELVPHIVEFAADRAALRPPGGKGHQVSKPSAVGETKLEEEDGDLPPLPAAEKTSASLLKSIFDPSDESDISEADNENESDDDEEQQQPDLPGKQEQLNPDVRVHGVGKPIQNVAQRDRHAASSDESSVSSDDENTFSLPPASEQTNDEESRDRKRSRSADGIKSGDAKRQAREDKRKHKKHKKHHRHRSRDDKEKKNKKDKKERKERKSHKYRSSRHSRRSRSWSAERSSSRHRSSSRRP